MATYGGKCGEAPHRRPVAYAGQDGDRGNTEDQLCQRRDELGQAERVQRRVPDGAVDERDADRLPGVVVCQCGRWSTDWVLPVERVWVQWAAEGRASWVRDALAVDEDDTVQDG